MPELRVSVVLPYYLRLAPGDYQTAREGEVVHVAAPLLDETTPPRTPVSAQSDLEDTANPNEVAHRRTRCAGQLLNRINRLLRWYRAVTRRVEITELTRAHVSPFRFEAISRGVAQAWTQPLEYVLPTPEPLVLTMEQLTSAVRDGLMGGEEPDVDVLFLLDAERALSQGRFREAVLLSWGTIDSVFNRRYDRLVDAAMASEWSEARNFFKGPDFGLRHKMTAGMRFMANRSLFHEPDGFWARLSESYSRRNAIIHRGENASEDEARQAIEVARRMIEIMNAIPVPGTTPPQTAGPTPEPGRPSTRKKKPARRKKPPRER